MLAAERRDEGALRSVLDDARDASNPEVQVFALDALARLTESDLLALHVAHVVDQGDRIDAAAAQRVRW